MKQRWVPKMSHVSEVDQQCGLDAVLSGLGLLKTGLFYRAPHPGSLSCSHIPAGLLPSAHGHFRVPI